jgi:hypothetical protein
MVSSNAELRSAVERLYQTFSRYRLPVHVEGCPHCVSDKDHALLYAKALRDLGPGELARYAFKALTTWGDENDFRHFLPRIFELISADGGDWTVPEAVFGKLPYGNWQTWPSDEQQAITIFFEALWSNVLDHYPHAFSAEECLRCIAQAVDDMSSYLGRWHIGQSLAHAKHFAEFVELDPQWSPRHGWWLNGPYWRNRPAPARQMVDWLCDPVRKRELEQACLNLASDEQDVVLLSKAIDDVARLS